MPEPGDSAHPPPQEPQGTSFRSIGGYEIEGELGRGGMGVVYLARQVELNRLVALKMLTGHYGPEELKRFVEEAETAAGLHHTNIAHIYEVGEHEGAPFYSMEHVKAGSLADLLRKEQPSFRDTATLLMNIARALHFAHQNGVVHRDMKPANVLLDPDGVPKIADFGIAKRLDDDSNLTRSGAVIGTPTYMAPEQARGKSRHAGPAADVYSLGAILYEMLAGRPPFLPEDSETAISVRVLSEDPVSPAWHRPGIPRDLETICMKCLEKEPRDRYSSAAALAEDLRRFLDDESILASPPSTVSKSIKWVRRHPWKFVGAAFVLLLAIVGVTRLVQWDLYQRSRVEYAARVNWVNGVLEPVEEISQDEASRRAYYLRLTRRGRSGPIIKVEVLNARGYPAELRQVLSDEMIPIYTEGVTWAQPYEKKLPESTTVEFSFDDNNNVLEATGRNRNGQVNWRILYDRPVASGSSGQTVGARFVNLSGFEFNSASHVALERDAKGRDVKVRFFNAAGWPVPNGEEVYGYKFEYDDAGRLTQLVNLGSDDQPTANSVGLIALAFSRGKEIRVEMRDAKGQPTLWNGIAGSVTELDGAGNAIRVTFLGADGKTARDLKDYWSVQEIKRNEHGEVTERTYFKADAEGALKQINQTSISYDEFGHPAERQIKLVWSSSRIVWRRDANGNIIEEKFLDANDRPVTNNEGYAIKRASYTSGQQGLRIEETYFDAAGAKTYSSRGYHRLIREYDPSGPLRRLIEDEHDPAKYKYYRYVGEFEYTSQWRLRRQVIRYEDAAGQVAVDVGDVPVTEELFDEQGRKTTEWKIGVDPKSFGGPVVRLDTEWHSTDKMKRRVQQVCDANRQPLSFISTGSASRFEEDFDTDGKWERIIETGFDEKLVGFSTREAKFSGGKFQSVIHERSDGTVLDSVRVIIKAVTPQPNQPKYAELKAGDQLVAANGKPVTSTHAWLFAGDFPGGWIEVLRDGRRIRIDGFVAGAVGVILEDRAP